MLATLRNFPLIPADAGIQTLPNSVSPKNWIPAGACPRAGGDGNERYWEVSAPHNGRVNFRDRRRRRGSPAGKFRSGGTYREAPFVPYSRPEATNQRGTT